MSEGLQCGILLVVLNLLAGNLGELNPPVRNYAGLALWLPVLLWNYSNLVETPASEQEAGPALLGAPKLPAWLRPGLALIVLILALIGFTAGRVHALAALLLTLWLVRRLANGTSSKYPCSEVLLLSAAGTGLWLIGRELSPQLFILNERLSLLSCRISSALAGTKFAFGPSYSGVPIFAILAWFHLSVMAVFRPRRWLVLLGFLASQLVLLLAYQVVFHALLSHWQLESAWVLLGTTQWALLVGGAALGMIHLRYRSVESAEDSIPLPMNRTDQKTRHPNPLLIERGDGKPSSGCGGKRGFRGALAWAGIATALVFACVADAYYPLFASRTRPKMLLYDDGTLDWREPVYGQYGGVRGGMFGSLAPFLQRHECEAWRGALTNLEQANVLVVFNLMHKFRPEEKRRIWEFIGRGGSLLAVGDHTGTTQIREPFNDLLEPVNIQFNFDSAMPIRREWVNGLQWFPQPATALLVSAADAQIMVGASLSVGPPAEPLVVGTYGWSDKGDLENRANGYLGDRVSRWMSV